MLLGGALIDESGHLWVAERMENPTDPGTWDAPIEWHVFDLEGACLGQVEVPRGRLIREVGHDYILGLANDDFGVEYVVRHRLDRR
jgi:hypothetical protein